MAGILREQAPGASWLLWEDPFEGSLGSLHAHTPELGDFDATESHPVFGALIKRAKAKGATMIVADVRVTELAGLADIHLQMLPGNICTPRVSDCPAATAAPSA